MPRVSTVKPDGAAFMLSRELAGLTQAELAELLKRPGMPVPPNRRKTISNIERGTQTLASLRLISQIARVCQVEPKTLIKSDAA